MGSGHNLKKSAVWAGRSSSCSSHSSLHWMATCATHRLEQIWPGLSCLQQAQKVQGILRDRAGLAVDLSMWLRDRRAANTALPNLWLHLKAWLLEMPTVGLQFMFHARIYGGRYRVWEPIVSCLEGTQEP